MAAHAYLHPPGLDYASQIVILLVAKKSHRLCLPESVVAITRYKACAPS